MTRKQDSARKARWKAELKQLLAEDRDLLKGLIQEALQQVLEAEMDEALQAEKGERTAGRLGYRSGHYGECW
jgi:transposase-like protein